MTFPMLAHAAVASDGSKRRCDRVLAASEHVIEPPAAMVGRVVELVVGLTRAHEFDEILM